MSLPTLMTLLQIVDTFSIPYPKASERVSHAKSKKCDVILPLLSILCFLLDEKFCDKKESNFSLYCGEYLAVTSLFFA